MHALWTGYWISVTNNQLGIKPRLLPTLPPSLRPPIPPAAPPHPQPDELPLHVPREHTLSFRIGLLHLHHFPGIQRTSLPAQYRTASAADPGPRRIVAGEFDCRVERRHARSWSRRPLLGSVISFPTPIIITSEDESKRYIFSNGKKRERKGMEMLMSFTFYYLIKVKGLRFWVCYIYSSEKNTNNDNNWVERVEILGKALACVVFFFLLPPGGRYIMISYN